MSEFLKSLNNFKPRPIQKFYIKTENTRIVYAGTECSDGCIEITRKDYLDIQASGIDSYEYNDNKLFRKTFQRMTMTITMHNELKPATENGYKFLRGDPFWVIDYKQSDTGIYSWQKK